MMNNKHTLFEISDELRQFEDALDSLVEITEGEIADEQTEQLFNEFFSNIGELKAERDRKLESYAWLIKEREAKAKARSEEATRLNALAQTDKNFADRLKKRLQAYFEANNIQKHETLHFKFAVQKNGGQTPVKFNDNIKPEDVAEEFRIISFNFNTSKIREALESGEELEFASLQERGKHLRIK